MPQDQDRDVALIESGAELYLEGELLEDDASASKILKKDCHGLADRSDGERSERTGYGF
jgi:hypothetical protein